MITSPLYDNPLAGGGLMSRRPNNPSDILNFVKPDFVPPLSLESANPNNLIGGYTPPTSGTGSNLQTPIGGLGLGFPGMGSLEEGMLFLPDKDNPRPEEEIQERYKQAQEEAARQRREGFLGQVVLPGEMRYEDFKAGNLFNFKRNPNLPDSAYKDFDMTGVAGFTSDTPSTKPIIDDASKKGLPETDQPPMSKTINSFDRVGEQLLGFSDQVSGFSDQFNSLTERLNKIEDGIASLLDSRGIVDNLNFNPMENFTRGVGSLFTPFEGFYGKRF